MIEYENYLLYRKINAIILLVRLFVVSCDHLQNFRSRVPVRLPIIITSVVFIHESPIVGVSKVNRFLGVFL